MWGRGGGGDPSRTKDKDSGFLEDPFDQQAATDAPAEWQGGGAWDDEATMETSASDGQEAEDSNGMMDGGGARSRPGTCEKGRRVSPSVVSMHACVHVWMYLYLYVNHSK